MRTEVQNPLRLYLIQGLLRRGSNCQIQVSCKRYRGVPALNVNLKC